MSCSEVLLLRNSKAESAVQVREVARERVRSSEGGGGELRYLSSYEIGQDIEVCYENYSYTVPEWFCIQDNLNGRGKCHRFLLSA